jgi:hypothetical protein
VRECSKPSGSPETRPQRAREPEAFSRTPSEPPFGICPPAVGVGAAVWASRAGDDKSRFETHVADLIGDKPVASVTRSDVEGIVEALDGKVSAGEMSWHTAWNVWAVVSRMFRDAANAKQRDLRVREDNPCANVAPPDRGIRRAKQFLYPSELVALMGCEEVALE